MKIARLRKNICAFAILASTPLFANGGVLDRVMGPEDSRVPQLSAAAPYSSIGLLEIQDETGESFTCTGTLISEDLVLTAAHCVLDDDDQVLPIIRFTPNLRPQGYTFSSEGVVVAMGNRKKTRSDDWAMLQLKSPLGIRFSFARLKALPMTTLTGRPVSLIGYSGDFLRATGAAAIHQNCEIRDSDRAWLLHDCDSTPGSSGSPIFIQDQTGKPDAIVAIHSSAKTDSQNRPVQNGVPYSFESANMAVPVSAFYETFQNLLPRLRNQPKQTTLNVCNRSRIETAWAAIALKSDGGWVVQGWVNIPQGQCVETFIGSEKGYHSQIQVYARGFKPDGSFVEWSGGGDQLCVGMAQEFNLGRRAAIACDARSQSATFMTPFKIAPGKLNVTYLD